MKIKHRKSVVTSQSHNVEHNCHVFHVCQHLAGNYDFFSDDRIAEQRSYYLGKYCDYYGVTILHSVTMSNHTHEILYCNCYEDMACALKSTNFAISRFIRHRVGTIPTEAIIFSSRPRYTAIKSIQQYYAESFYLFSNPGEGFNAKHSSFSLIAKGCIPFGFDESAYELFGLVLSDYMAALRLPYPEYQNVIRRVCSRFSRNMEDQIFKIRPNEPFET